MEEAYLPLPLSARTVLLEGSEGSCKVQSPPAADQMHSSLPQVLLGDCPVYPCLKGSCKPAVQHPLDNGACYAPLLSLHRMHQVIA